MSLRNKINSALKEAMKEKAQLRLSTLRLITAAIKDRDISARAEGVEEGVDDSEILGILGKMTRQRQESAKTYEEAGRLDLSERELSEIQVIEYFLPRQLNSDEIEIEVTKVIDEQGASSIRDMGRVMACLKERFTGQMDFGSVGPIVKRKLSN